MTRQNSHQLLALCFLSSSLLMACGGSDEEMKAPTDSGKENPKDSEDSGSSDDDAQNLGGASMGGSGAGGASQEEFLEVVWSNIEDGQKGVLPNEVIQIEFSEAIDIVSFEEAYTSASLADVTFSWSEDEKAVTITPDAPFTVAAAKSLEELDDAAQYGFSLGQSLVSQSGKSLGDDYAVTFSAARRLTHTLQEEEGGLTGHVRSDGGFQANTDFMLAGDSGVQDEIGDAQYVATLSFPLDTIEPTYLGIKSATLRMNQETFTNAPEDLGDAPLVYDIQIEERTWDAVAPQLSAGHLLGSAKDTLIWKTLDVKDVLSDDIANSNVSQFALALPTARDNDNKADTYEYTGVHITVVYYVE